MKRQEFLLNFTLLIVIGALVYKTYEARQEPDTLEALAQEVPAKPPKAKGAKKDAPPETETSYEVASAGDGGSFGKRDLFRALLTPTPTPTPTPPPPPPTPDIGKALGPWKLLSVYEGKAMMEDVVKSQQGAEGAIWEMTQGQTRQVDVGSGIMKTVTLTTIDDKTDPYNPEVTFTMEDTTANKKINLDTEPAAAAPGPAPGAPQPPQPK